MECQMSVMDQSFPSGNPVTARLDSRGRLNLTPFKPTSDTFIVTVSADGTIELTPALVVPMNGIHREPPAPPAADAPPLGDGSDNGAEPDHH
jgi:hypothetical protein